MTRSDEDAIAHRWSALTANQRLAVARIDEALYILLDASAAGSRFALSIDLD